LELSTKVPPKVATTSSSAAAGAVVAARVSPSAAVSRARASDVVGEAA
jgi:hypothetical protein